MIRTNLFLPETQRAAMRQLAQTTGIPASEHVRRAIDAYLAALRTSTQGVAT